MNVLSSDWQLSAATVHADRIRRQRVRKTAETPNPHLKMRQIAMRLESWVVDLADSMAEELNVRRPDILEHAMRTLLAEKLGSREQADQYITERYENGGAS
jgi:hypothetical protein